MQTSPLLHSPHLSIYNNKSLLLTKLGFGDHGLAVNVVERIRVGLYLVFKNVCRLEMIVARRSVVLEHDMLVGTQRDGWWRQSVVVVLLFGVNHGFG